MTKTNVLSIDIGSKNLAYCLLETERNDDNVREIRIIEWNMISIGSNYKDTAMFVNELYFQLDDIMTKGVDLCLIERQPKFNMKMNMISMMVFSYFCMHSLDCEFVSPKLKLEGIKGLNYRGRKQKAIEMCKELLNDVWIDYLNGFKKQDDLADCFLQAVMYLKQRR